MSIPYLYKNDSVRKRIEHLRTQLQTKSTVKQPKSNDAAKDSIIETLRERVKELQKENQDLKKQVEIAYGRIVTLEAKKGR